MRFERRVFDLVRMELLVNPCVNAHRQHLLHVAGPGTEGQSIERMYGALLFCRSGLGRGVFLLRKQLRNGQSEAQA